MDERDYKAINDKLKEEHQIGDTNEKVTAVEWFANQVEDFLGLLPVDIIEKAKELEKQQHGSTWDAAIQAHDDRGHVHARSLVDFDEYYQETYKK